MRLVEGTATVEDVDAFVAALGEVGAATGCTVQAFDARYVVGREHLERAVTLADRAFDRGENVARDRSVEILLYAAGRRQIDQALEMGVGEGDQPVVIVVDGDDDGNGDDGSDEASAAAELWALLEPTETLGAYDEARVRAFFDVRDPELRAAGGDLASLVAERVALLDVEK